MAGGNGAPGRAAPQIRFALAQLRSRNGHHEFEHLCREVARLRITSNILPATGPVSAGGDQGRDFETFRTYVRERPPGSFLAVEESLYIVFACTLQRENLPAKIMNDLRAITDGGPADRVYFFCEQDIPVARRHELRQRARENHGTEIEIIDGQALSELLAAEDCLWIAERYLGIEASGTRLGTPSPGESSSGSFNGISGTGIRVDVIHGDVNIYHSGASGAAVTPDAAIPSRPPRKPANRHSGHGTGMVRRLAIIVATAAIAATALIAADSLTHGSASSPGPALVGTPYSWISKAGGSVNTTAVADGTVYIGVSIGQRGKVEALNAATGAVRWTRATGGPVFSVPVVSRGIVYVGCDDHKVYALDALTGHVRWTQATGGWVVSRPAVADGVVYVGSTDGKVYALDALTGHVRWTHATGGGVQSSATVVGDTVYIGSGDHNLYALYAATGAVRWTFTTGNGILSSPLVAAGTVYIGSQDGRVYAVNAVTGKSLWNYNTGKWIFFSSPVLADGKIYIGSTNGKVYALDAATSRPWRIYPNVGEIQASAAIAGGNVYIGSLDDKLCAINAFSGDIVWTYPTRWGGISDTPVVAGATVYFGSNNGNLYAVNASTGK